MARKPGSSRPVRSTRKGRALTEGEQRLWQEVTKDITRYKAMSAAVSTPVQPQLQSPTKGSGLQEKARPKRWPSVVHGSAHPPSPQQASQPVSVFKAGDPAMDKRVRRGRMEIDAVLDLHGLTQVAAQDRLRRFVALARHQGARCVLVITGKGGTPSVRKPADRFDLHEPPRGVLRMRFLEWVEQAPLRADITRVAPAKLSDGGGGAFYVFLKPKN